MAILRITLASLIEGHWCIFIVVLFVIGFNPSNNKYNLGYNSNRTYITVLNMSPYVENPRREIFHQISQSSKFLHYRATLHDT